MLFSLYISLYVTVQINRHLPSLLGHLLAQSMCDSVSANTRPGPKVKRYIKASTSQLQSAANVLRTDEACLSFLFGAYLQTLILLVHFIQCRMRLERPASKQSVPVLSLNYLLTPNHQIYSQSFCAYNNNNNNTSSNHQSLPLEHLIWTSIIFASSCPIFYDPLHESFYDNLDVHFRFSFNAVEGNTKALARCRDWICHMPQIYHRQGLPSWDSDHDIRASRSRTTRCQHRSPWEILNNIWGFRTLGEPRQVQKYG